MTEPMQPEPSEARPALPELEDTTPLQNLASELHEIYVELVYAGFKPAAAAQIVAQVIASTFGYDMGGNLAVPYSDDDDDDVDEDNSEDDEPV